MIYWTNLLIQCLVPVPIFCMFFVSQIIHIKRSPNAINFMKNYFGIYVIFESWNHRKWRPVVGTTTRARSRSQACRGGLCPP